MAPIVRLMSAVNAASRATLMYTRRLSPMVQASIHTIPARARVPNTACSAPLPSGPPG